MCGQPCDQLAAQAGKKSYPTLGEDKKEEKEDAKKSGFGVPVFKEPKSLGKKRVENRHMCFCACKQHALINNCTSCGKVVCAEEGVGPCLFCGAYVDYKENVKNNSEAFLKAAAVKDRLLDYDRNSRQRTKVYRLEITLLSRVKANDIPVYTVLLSTLRMLSRLLSVGRTDFGSIFYRLR